MLARGVGTSSSTRWLRVLAELFPGVALLLATLLVCAPASAPVAEESKLDSRPDGVAASSSEDASMNASLGILDEAMLVASAAESLSPEAETEGHSVPEPQADANDDRAPARAVGMCGDHAQSIEAPPPIYPGSGAAMRGCAAGGEQVEKVDALLPLERLALDSAPAYRTAVLAEPLRIFRASSSTIDFPAFERFVTEEHRAREPRPPRG